jgi:hypothetical protein
VSVEDKKALGAAHLNPMFVCLRNGLMLHYGVDPLLGFHLALSRIDLKATSPLKPAGVAPSMPEKFNEQVKTSITQFSAWCEAFRKSYRHCTIRVVKSDAIAFCHVVKEGSTGEWYRNPSDYRPLVLDSTDYGAGGTGPTSFDMIDTSNLTDHLGSLNVLSAVRPLVRMKPASAIQTEMLLPREATISDSANKLLCGDLPTIALVLGLKPVHYWTNATATWHVNDKYSPALIGHTVNSSSVWSRQLIVWRPVSTTTVRFDSLPLAQLLYCVYLKTFEDESWAKRFESLNVQDAQKLQKLTQFPLYTRASLTLLLSCVKNLDVCSWSEVVDQLVQLILNDPHLNMGPHYIQSFFVHLRLLEHSNLEKLDFFHPGSYRKDLNGPLRGWKDIPAVVCITLKVPHSALRMFQDLKYGTPICHLALQSSITKNQCYFADVQLGFGRILTTGTPFSNDYAIEVQQDAKGWKGSSPLVVSALVPTCFLTEHGDPACEVHFALKSVPATAMLISKLGMELAIHKSAVGKSDVLITKYRPNLHAHMSISPEKLAEEFPYNGKQGVIVRIVFPTNGFVDHVESWFLRPILAPDNEKVVSAIVHVDIKSGEALRLLRGGAKVEFQLVNPFRLILSIGSGECRREIELPIPVTYVKSKTRIARKSEWVEYEADVCGPAALACRNDLVFPMNVDGR